jgi:hypothetical protein
MKTVQIIGGIIVLVLIAGALYFYAIKSPNSITVMPVTPLSLKELIAQGVTQQCTAGAVASSTEAQGTFYINGSKVRGDFTSLQVGKPVNSHLIADGTTVYSWIDGTAVGLQTSELAAKPVSTGGAQQGFDFDMKMNYTCSSWTADPAKFTLPPNITFKDMAAVLQDALQGSAAPTL